MMNSGHAADTCPPQFPLPAPAEISPHAMRSTMPASSAHVTRRSPNTSASASGFRAAQWSTDCHNNEMSPSLFMAFSKGAQPLSLPARPAGGPISKKPPLTAGFPSQFTTSK